MRAWHLFRHLFIRRRYPPNVSEWRKALVNSRRLLRPTTGYKLLFSHPRVVEDLLRGFVGEDWVEGLDYTTLEKVSGSYINDDLRDHEDDCGCAPETDHVGGCLRIEY